jgi:hypothetical protein
MPPASPDVAFSRMRFGSLAITVRLFSLTIDPSGSDVPLAWGFLGKTVEEMQNVDPLKNFFTR